MGSGVEENFINQVLVWKRASQIPPTKFKHAMSTTLSSMADRGEPTHVHKLLQSRSDALKWHCQRPFQAAERKNHQPQVQLEPAWPTMQPDLAALATPAG